MHSENMVKCTPKRAIEVLTRAKQNSKAILDKATRTADQFFREKSLDPHKLCLLVVGSVGRLEALEASDFDCIPIAGDQGALNEYKPHDKELRTALGEALGLKVSKGEDLTSAVSLSELTKPECIGGTEDGSSPLTKRILILTESQQVAGGLALDDIRRKILSAYAEEDRTSGRHVLSLCNDIARYYKLLCIEYKAKIDDEEKDWCTRNMKLRHSRKFWYFSSIVAFATLSEQHPLGSSEYGDALLEAFDKPPCERLVSALGTTQTIALGRMIESYAMFLEFMSKRENREALASVNHQDRYAMAVGNPFPAMKFNSDVLHQCMISILDGMSRSMRDRVISWFLL